MRPNLQIEGPKHQGSFVCITCLSAPELLWTGWQVGLEKLRNLKICSPLLVSVPAREALFCLSPGIVSEIWYF